MKIYRANKFRIYPNQIQQDFINKTFGNCRFLWNMMLDERIQVYQKMKSTKEDLYTHKYLTEKQYKQKFTFLKEVDSRALQSSRENLIIAYKNFFRGLRKNQKIGFPKFKSRKSKQSYTTYNINNNIKINFEKRKLKLPKITSWIKFRDNRKFSENIKQVTVSKTKSRKYFVSILIEKEIDIKQKQNVQLAKIDAFDMSTRKFLISMKTQMNNPHFYRNEEKNLKRIHRRVSRKVKGSINQSKSNLKLARKYEKIFRRKLDWAHKICREIAERNDVVILENLSIKGMQQFNSGLSKSITLDFSWNQFLSILKYKMIERGNILLLVSRWFPSSKRCSYCGWINIHLKISERWWVCPKCKKKHDRDINASKNLLIEGIKQLRNQKIRVISTVGLTGSHAWGDDIRLSFGKQSSMNQEISIN